MSTKTSIFCQIMPEKNQVKNFDPSKNEKNAQICASSHICILCFQGCIDCKESTKNFKRHISSNGPHLVSPQKAQQFSKTQDEVTVKPYIISFFYCHPVCAMPMCNAYVQCLCSMPMFNTCVQFLCAIPVCNAYV